MARHWPLLCLLLCALPGWGRAVRAQSAPAPASAPADSTTAEPGASPAPAPGTAPLEAPEPVPEGAGPLLLSMTVSGGASLGAYQAGYLYYVLGTLQRHPGVADVRTFTGTSSGSIDAFMGALASCGAGLTADPTDSPLYTLWHGVDLGGLYRPKEVSSVAMFSRRSFEPHVDALQKLWEAGLPTECDVLLGMTATRIGHHEIPLGDGSVRLPQTEIKFALRIQGNGKGKLPRVTNYVDTRHRMPQALLVLGSDPSKHFDRIRDVLYASSAFPLAFAPVELEYCMSDTRESAPLECDPASTERAAFVDGGIMDHQPLRLAATLLSSGLERRPGGALITRERPDRTLQELPPRSLFAYVDSDTADYPTEDAAPTTGTPEDAIDLVMRLFEEFMATARAKELLVLLEERPEVARAVRVARSRFPNIGGHLAKFFGFVDAGFRDFDFYLGMYSARRDLEQRIDLGVPESWQRGENGRIEGTAAAPRPGFEKLACMRAAFDGMRELEPFCSGAALANFRILVQASLDRLYAHCAELRKLDPVPTTSHPHCLAAIAGQPAPRIASARNLRPEDTLRHADEDDFDHTLRLLGSYGYRFDGLGLSRDDAPNARRVLRDRLDEVLERFAEAQPDNRLYVKAASDLLVQYLAYVPRAHELRILLGSGLELGYSFRFPVLGWEWLRPTLTMQLDGLGSLLSSRENYFAFTPQLGFEVEPVGLNGVAAQLRFGLRGGYLLASTSGVHSCPPVEVRGEAPCSSYTLGGYVSLTLLELLRLQLNGNVYPNADGEQGTAWSIAPAFGAELWPF